MSKLVGTDPYSIEDDDGSLPLFTVAYPSRGSRGSPRSMFVFIAWTSKSLIGTSWKRSYTYTKAIFYAAGLPVLLGI